MEALVEGGPFARINRAWHIRVTRFLAAEAGLTQFLDLGPAATGRSRATRGLGGGGGRRWAAGAVVRRSVMLASVVCGTVQRALRDRSDPQ